MVLFPPMSNGKRSGGVAAQVAKDAFFALGAAGHADGAAVEFHAVAEVV